MGAPIFLTKAKAQKVKKKKNDWLCGYACALASVIQELRRSDGARVIREVFGRDAIDLAELKAADVEKDDLDVITQTLK